MFEDILQSEVQLFIKQNENVDIANLVLQHKQIHNVPISAIAQQISARRKAREKIPLFYGTSDIIYPPTINLEQSSSQAAAVFKSTLLAASKRGSCIDLTGGLGIDSFFFSKHFSHVHYVERDERLSCIAKHNHQKLDAFNITHHVMDAEAFVKKCDLVDFIFIDPSRRGQGHKKVVKLSECEPNVIVIQDAIFSKTDTLMVKASPLLDIQQGLRELKNVKHVFVVSVENDCKEVLFLCDKGYEQEAELTAINIKHNITEKFSFSLSQERQAKANFSAPDLYLYEPNASLLKAGAFKTIANHYHLSKLHMHTHLYTSSQLVRNFPGRVFKIESILKASNKTISASFPDGKANVITRNYPLSPEQLKKKLKLNDGGDKFLIAFSGIETKYLCLAHKVQQPN